MLNVHNFALGTVSIGYDAAATSIVLTTGHGARFPAGPFRATWWNQTDHPNPADDPNREIVEVTTRSTDTLTIVRGLETAFGGLAASTKNIAGKVYGFALVPTAELLNRTTPVRGLFHRRSIARLFTHHRWDGMSANTLNGGTINDIGALNGGSDLFMRYGTGLKLGTGVNANGESGLSTSQANQDDDDWYGWLASEFSEMNGVMTYSVPVLSDGTQTFSVWIGFGTNIAAVAAKSRFAGVRILANAIELAAKNDGTLTLGAASTIAANTEYHLRIKYKPGVSVEAWLDGAYIGILSTGFSATSTRRLWAVKILKSAGTTTRLLHVGPHGYEVIRT